MHNNSAHITIYKASAGSGKTYALTKEYIRMLLAAPGNYKHILAVTFTNKACGEMKERILHTLYTLSNNYDSVQYANELCEEFSLKPIELQKKAQRVLHDILHNYSFFYVETIDTFFQRIIRNFAKELGLHSYFGLELDTSAVIEESVQNLFQNIHEYPEIEQWLIDYSIAKIDDGKNRNVFRALLNDSSILFKEQYMQLTQKSIEFADIVTFFEHVDSLIQTFETNIRELAEKAIGIITKHGLQVEDFKGGSRSCMKPFYILAQQPNDKKYLKLEAILDTENWFTKTSKQRHLIGTLEQAGLLEITHSMFSLYMGNEGITYRTALLLSSQKYSVGMLQAIQKSIDTYCRDNDLFLISNTNMFLQTIIQGSDAPFVYEKIGCFIRHIMIDEFQDTSQMQWQNFLPLISNAISEGGSALVVGDVKQSIYRFRNGDWSLLHSGIYNDFIQEISEISLSHNWRSRKNIIEFNNTFFQLFSSILQQKYIGTMTEAGLTEIPDKLQSLIPSLYADVEQLIPTRSNDGGYVNLHTISADKESKFPTLVLEQLLVDVLQLFEKGYAPRDIVFLCKEKKHISQIVTFFNEKKQEYPEYAQAFTIVTGEGLRISKSDVVQFILAYLQWMEQPENNFFRTELSVIYNRLQLAQTNDSVMQVQTKANILGDIPSISKNMSLHLITDNIIQQFSLHTHTQELVYLLDFQNIIYSYSKKNMVSISQFIEWWHEQEDTAYLKQEPQGYMRAMTMHKSKGLQFSVVFMPFVDWQYSRSNSTMICNTIDTDFSAIPFAYVSQKKEMATTQFAKQYAEEIMQQYIDSINVFYVACTRAVDALFVYIPENSQTNRISHEIVSCLAEYQLQYSQHTIDNTCIEIGTLDTQAISQSIANNVGTEYPIYTEKLELLPVPETYRFIERMQSSRHEQIQGIRMHRIFEFILSKNDISVAVHKAIAEGIIEENQYQEYVNYCTQAIEQSNVSKWFDTTYRIQTEQGISTPEGEKRPDRLVFTEANTIEVIDYKFTLETQTKHIHQVQEYVRVLQSMGYTVTGYVWYVLLHKVLEV